MLHIDLPTRSQIDRLVAFRGFPAVSIYLRTTPQTRDVDANRIELKNLLKRAVAQMEEADTPRRSTRPIQENVEALVEDDEFWATQANSLAIFAMSEGIRTFRLGNKLTNSVEVSDRFHLNPLLRSVTFPHHAYVLALGVGAVRLIEVSADLPPHVVPVPDLPRDFRQALGRRSHLERDGDMRSGEGTSENALLTRYSRTIDQALRSVLAGDERPLIVAATEPLASIFRAVSSYPHLTRQVIPGSADDTPDHVLASAAREVLDQVYAEEVRQLHELYAARESQGRATCDIAQAARAATFGAVDTLLVDMNSSVPGTISEEDGSVVFGEQPGATSYGVTDEIARRVLRSGGRVLAVRRTDLPLDAELAALLRYPF